MDDRTLLAELADHPDTHHVTSRFAVETWPLGHHLPAQLHAYAAHVGATVDYRSAGSWWHKVHYFTVRGTVAQVRAVTLFKMRMADDG